MSDGLAYCIYGNFVWPPAPDDANVAPETNKAPGCVVIRYLKTGDIYRGGGCRPVSWATIAGLADQPKRAHDGGRDRLHFKAVDWAIRKDFLRGTDATCWLDEVERKLKIEAQKILPDAAPHV